MTRIIFNGNNGETGNVLVSNEEAVEILRTLNSVDTFVFDGIMYYFVESQANIAKNKGSHHELLVIGSEVQ